MIKELQDEAGDGMSMRLKYFCVDEALVQSLVPINRAMSLTCPLMSVSSDGETNDKLRILALSTFSNTMHSFSIRLWATSLGPAANFMFQPLRA
jgi:hypothetical protein